MSGAEQKVGSLFSGMEGLGLPFAGQTSYVCEVDKFARKVLAARRPDVRLLEDVTELPDDVPEVDVLHGGSPCTDLSFAGQRLGMVGDTRSGLWAYQAEAIARTAPTWAVWENVAAALSGKAFTRADCDPDESDPRRHRTGGAPHRMRALGRVLADLHLAGYDAAWTTIKASDVGACHARDRVFVLARRRDRPGAVLELDERFLTGPAPSVCDLLPTPRANDGNGGAGTSWSGGPGLREVVLVDPLTPGGGMVRRYGKRPVGADGKPIRRRGESHLLPTPVARHDGGASSTRKGGQALSILARDELAPGGQLLPTPVSADGEGGRAYSYHTIKGVTRDVIVGDDPGYDPTSLQDWGPYEAAIRRAEAVVGRPAPAPVEPGVKRPWRLSRFFTEWMMMLPAGWVTDVPGVSYMQSVKMLGNGVVPFQAAAAVSYLAPLVGAGGGKPWAAFDEVRDVWVLPDGVTRFDSAWPRAGVMAGGDVTACPTFSDNLEEARS